MNTDDLTHSGHLNQTNAGVTLETVAPQLGIVLIAHGSRRAEANAELHVVATGLRQRGFPLVVPSYLELCDPDIVHGGRQCVALGADRVVLSPYFLSAGRHVHRDLEEARQQLAAEFPQIPFALAGPLGPHVKLEELLVERIHHCLASAANATSELPDHSTSHV